MDAKRKAPNSAGVATLDAEDRSAKRRKLLEEYNLSQGETPESTTQYGLNFVEQLRRTTDKTHRLIATAFEKLPPRAGNADYYRRIRLPICLESIAKKLQKRDFADLTELECYFKRMIINVKEYYPRDSEIYIDAERIRKSLSNYMTKTNPAYYQSKGFQAFPTPLPPETEEPVQDDANSVESDPISELGQISGAETDGNPNTDSPAGADAESHEEFEADDAARVESDRELTVEARTNTRAVVDTTNVPTNELDADDEVDADAEADAEVDADMEEGLDGDDDAENDTDTGTGLLPNAEGLDTEIDVDPGAKADVESNRSPIASTQGDRKDSRSGSEKLDSQSTTADDVVDDEGGNDGENEGEDLAVQGQGQGQIKNEGRAERRIKIGSTNGARDSANGDGKDRPKTSVILRRRDPTRSVTETSTPPAKITLKVSVAARPDSQYEGVSYNNLTFQQAQEKVVEEILRKRGGHDEEAYFEPFIQLPPRVLKDYYKIIARPMSLRKLHRMTKGVHGRGGGEVTGISEFKTWAAFEEKSNLLWNNAYYYNEESSGIYKLAKELQVFFRVELQRAKNAVQDPTPPKIKLKVATAVPEPQSAGPRRITLHIGGRGPSSDTNGTAPSPDIPLAPAVSNGIQPPNASLPVKNTLDSILTATSFPANVATTTPGTRLNAITHDLPKQKDFKAPPSVSYHTNHAVKVNSASPPVYHTPSTFSRTMPVSVGSGLWDSGTRRPGRGASQALISALRIHTPPHHKVDPVFSFVLPAHATQTFQHAAIHLPLNHSRLQLTLNINTSLHDVQHKIIVLLNRQILSCLPSQPPTLFTRNFDLLLLPGTNTLDVQIVAAVRAIDRVAGGPEAELEHFVVYLQLPRA